MLSLQQSELERTVKQSWILYTRPVYLYEQIADPCSLLKTIKQT